QHMHSLQIHTLSLHDALPIWTRASSRSANIPTALFEGRCSECLITRSNTANTSRMALAGSSDKSAMSEKAAARLISTTSRIRPRSEEHTSELQSREKLVCRLV